MIPAVLSVPVAAILCYDNLLFSFFLIPLGIVLGRRLSRMAEEKQRWQLRLAFRDAINCISASLESGYSVENAITEAVKDLSYSYQPQHPIMTELKLIISKVRNNIPVEDAFLGMAKRTGIRDIADFADVFAIAKRTEGNIIRVVRRTADNISTNVEINRDMRIAISSKRFEMNIMKCIPPGVIVYQRLFSAEVKGILYGNIFGIGFMTVLLGIYVLLCVWSERITTLKD